MLFIMFLPESGVPEPYGCCVLCIPYVLCTLRILCTLQLLHVLIVGFHKICRVILLRFFLFNMFFRRFLRYFCRPGIFGIGLLHIALIRCDAAVFLFRKVPEHTEQKQKHNYR